MGERRGKHRTLLCDADGTLLQSWDWILGGIYHAAEKLGFPAEKKIVEDNFLSGISLWEFYKKYAAHLDTNECIRTHQEYQARNMDLIVPFPGVVETLHLLHEAGVQLGIVTSRKSSKSLEGTLTKMGVDSLFGAIICLDDVALPKPDPAGIILAMRKLGSEKVNTFFVGDTKVDMEAGKSAGVTTIGALYGFGREQLAIAGADHYIESFSEVLDIIRGK
jgi:HAD superfamily hydrolase (TIGR01509 family)